jgi:predicted metal-binding membrane protein
MAIKSSHTRQTDQDTCNDQVVGAILSGWRYDISEISPDLRVDYEAHLYNCPYCRRRQRVHRMVDMMLLAITTLSFAAFLLAALVMHRVEAMSHISNVQHLHLHEQGTASLLRIPSSVTISLEAVAIVGVLVSMLLWTLVTITTPIPSMISAIFHERISPELRERLRKQAI